MNMTELRVEPAGVPAAYRTPSFRDLQAQCAFLMGQVRELEASNQQLSAEVRVGKVEIGRAEAEVQAMQSQLHAQRSEAKRVADQVTKDAVSQERTARTLDMAQQQLQAQAQQAEAAAARESQLVADLSAARKGQREAQEQLRLTHQELREMTSQRERAEVDNAHVMDQLSAQRTRGDAMLGEIAACARLRETHEMLREGSARLREECDDIRRQLLAANEARGAAQAQLDACKSELDGMVQRAQATAERCLEENTARVKAEITIVSLQVTSVYQATRHTPTHHTHTALCSHAPAHFALILRTLCNRRTRWSDLPTTLVLRMCCICLLHTPHSVLSTTHTAGEACAATLST